jgi:hypothetical protein
VIWLVGLLLAAGPGEWVLPGFRMHVVASEELDPDRLRALARPEVVLWLRTRSNGLRRSTAETVRLAGSAFVEVRPPLGAPALAPFVGRVGPWLALEGLDVARAKRWSPGRMAVEVEGPLTEEVAGRLRVLRPVAVRWSRGGWPAREEWVRARTFPGVELSGAPGGTVDCAGVPPHTRVQVRVPLESRSSEVCGLPVRVEIPPDADRSEVQEALLARADSDLLVEVREDLARADAVRRLLDSLEASTPAGHRPGADAGAR